MLFFKKKETCLYETFDGVTRLVRYSGSAEQVDVAAEYEGSPVTEIGENAFYDASKAVVINLPATIKKIGTNAFRGCKALKELTLPDSVEELGDYAFAACKSLERVAFSKKITSLPEGCFSKCTGMTEIRLPDTIKAVGEEAFAGCSELKSIDLGKGVKTIGENAFKGCSGKLSIVLPAEIAIEDRALLENADMIYRRLPNGGLALLKYGGHDTVIEMPDKLGDEYITAIGPQVFYMFAYLEKIKLPGHLTYIAEQAFAGCSGLTSIEFPETLEYIGKSAFSACGPRVNRPGYMARRAQDINEDGGIAEIVLPAKLRTVDDMAFAGCSALKKVTIMNGKTALGGACFLGCPMESIELPEGMTEIQAEMFRGCSQLKSVKLPRSLESIWQRAFVDCEALEEIVLPEKLQVIAEGAFMGCVSLKKLAIPFSVREIEDEVFAFDALEELTVADNSKYFEMINGCLIGKKTGKLITAIVEEGASLTVPGSANEIGSLAFAGAPISELTVPAHVKKIGQWALRSSAIKKLTILNPDIELGNGILVETEDVELLPEGSPAIAAIMENGTKEN